MAKKWFLIFALLVPVSLSAQVRTVTGTVSDSVSGEPLPGVSVFLESSRQGVISGIDGEWSLNGASDGDALVFSLLGYGVQRVVVSEKDSYAVRLVPESLALNETVFIGYGNTTKKEITGSVASVGRDGFNSGAYSDAMGLLQGKVAGLSIVNPGGGDPNAAYEILLRGANTLVAGQGPLLIIDGVAGADIRDINFQDVESVDVLKDGSAAAIYGTRGTNGVIIITTRRARSGETSVEYDGQLSVETVARRAVPLSADEYRDVINTYRPELSANIYGSSTDWFREITRTPVSHRHNLSVAGGSEKFSHRTVLNCEQNQGLQRFNDLNKFSLRSNIRQSALEGWLDMDYNLFVSHRKLVPASSDAFVQAFMHNPTEPVHNPADIEAGGWNRISQMAYYNPAAMIYERDCLTENDSYGANVRIKINILPIPGLYWDNFVSAKRSSKDERQYYTKYYPSLIGTNGQATIEDKTESDIQFESVAGYSHSFGLHRLQAVAGYTFQYGYYTTSYMSNSGFDTDAWCTNNIGAGLFLTSGTAGMSSYKEDNTYIAVFGRAIWNYDDRYMCSLSLRRDGSSRFGRDHKWGWFPAVSAGWRISREPFMSSVQWLDDLKLRAGYGVTGNQDFDSYKSIVIMRSSGHFFYDGRWINTYQPASNANPDLAWEKKAEFNLGADFSVLKGRLSGTLDYYRRVTSDLLYSYSVPTPPYIYNTYFTNVGQITNQGIEFSLTAVPVSGDALKWTTSLTAAHNSNVLDSFTNENFKDAEYKVGWASGGACFSQRLVEGESLGTFYAPHYIGTDKYGDDVLEKQNNRGEVDESNWINAGCAYPDLTLGWTNSLVIGRFDLQCQIRASIGGEILNCYALEYDNLAGLNYTNISSTWLEHNWKTGLTYRYSDRFIEDATYLKLDNLSVGYSIPMKGSLLKKVHMSLTAQNLLCLTTYSGVDPEVSLLGVAPGFGDTG
ncbi:MAG: SusC/RagA family TonB-linked outer membrane protein, partial [Bacteroidales bacterium]|nr:SusC/RagA family TonB-linked outer membrane protein [Bacteroidales bacterium]